MLLKQGNVKDLDIYISLGFKDISYFRKSFKKQFGVTPTQFIRSQTFGGE
jgi:AraC-like DNA-binding protein